MTERTQIYLAWIAYNIGAPQLMGVFNTPEEAQMACQMHYQKENYTALTLNWARARNIIYNSIANVGSYRYLVRQETMNTLIKP